jgi:hypothetical protein
MSDVTSILSHRCLEQPTAIFHTLSGKHSITQFCTKTLNLVLVTAIQQLPFRGVGFNEIDGAPLQTPVAAHYTQHNKAQPMVLVICRISSPANVFV